MTYRNLTVDGTVYRYVIGKKTTKIRPPEGKAILVDNSKIGYKVGGFSGYRSPLTPVPDPEWFMVTPGTIADYLRTGNTPVVEKCHREDCQAVDMLVVDPFAMEIYNRKVFVKACERCYLNSCDDI